MRNRLVMKYSLLAFFIFAGILGVLGQSKSIIAGTVKDLENNKFTQNINVKLLSVMDSSLYKISLTDYRGGFVFEDCIPAKYILRLQHVGYITKDTIIDAKQQNRVTVDNINIKLKNTLIDSVFVTPAIYYKKDTLEINSDSFGLDSNAVIEDLLKKVPNFVIWGNGDITYKGEKIKSFVLNGQQFLSGNPEIILQNIPASATSTIQLYARSSDKSNSKNDSNLELNIKTKSKSLSYFGALEHILSKRYDSSVGLTLYLPNKFQSTFFFNRNNVNKDVTNNLDFLLNSAYKSSQRIPSEDILKLGINRNLAFGTMLKYTFTDKPDREEINRIGFEGSKDIRSAYSNRQSNIDNPDISFSQNQVHVSERRVAQEKYNLDYQYKKNKLLISSKLSLLNSKIESTTSDSSFFQLNEDISSENMERLNSDRDQNLVYELNYSNILKKSKIKVKSSIRLGLFDKLSTENILFSRDVVNDDREINDKEKGHNNVVKFDLRNIPFYQKLNLKSFVNISNEAINLKDDRKLINNETFSPSLSYNNNSKKNINMARMGIEYAKYLSLTNRYSKSYNFQLFVSREALYAKQTSSNALLGDKFSQQLFSPGLSFNYEKNVLELTTYKIDIKVDKRLEAMELDYRVFLIDTLSRFNVFRPNNDLKSGTYQNIDLVLSKDKSSFNSSLEFNLKLYNNAIIDQIDRSTSRYVYRNKMNNEGDSYKSTLSANFRKYLKIKESQVTLRTNLVWTSTDLPIILNNDLINGTNNRFNFNFWGDININEHLLIGISNSASIGLIKRETDQTYSNNRLKLDVQKRFIKDFKISGSSIYDYAKFSQQGKSSTVLNFAIEYRFLKKRNAEINLNLWDALGNNKGIENSFDGVNYVYGTESRITRYLSLGFKFYPRKF
ncbi:MULTISPECIES: hypothetical protein [Sphingobacterium]|uniref:hypothetical protein n=1 Tax=Sphingobacterium TaxID=28453 RepID=UPI0013DB06C7|nr:MULTISPECIES: hypothetical protein [unclassified Sphingobacterium]